MSRVSTGDRRDRQLAALRVLVRAAIEEYTAARDYRIAPKVATERAVKE